MPKTYTVKLTRNAIYQICDALNAKRQVFEGYLADRTYGPVSSRVVWQEAVDEYAAIRDGLLLAAADSRADRKSQRAADQHA